MNTQTSTKYVAWAYDFIWGSQSLVLQGHIQSNDNVLELLKEVYLFTGGEDI
jgi:hypothetical protein